MSSFGDMFTRRSKGGGTPARESIDILNAIIGHMVVPMFVLDREGKVTIWNEACEKLTGLAAASVIGTKKHWKGFYLNERPCLADLVFKGADAEVARLYASHDDGAAKTGRMRAQNWCDLPKGVRRYLQIDAGPIRGPDGGILFVVETLQDQTALKEAESAIEAQREGQSSEYDRIRDALGEGLGRLAQGDLEIQIDVMLPGAADELRKDFNSAVRSLNDLFARIFSITGVIDDGARKIVASTRDVTNQSQSQRVALAQTAQSLNRITATVRDNAAGADAARAIVGEAKQDAERSGIVVREAIDAINEIEKSSKQIGNIIGVIDEFAFQTNLLALNAGVEAARAGDSGRGFAVVAQEVRALAQRSADAAKEIKTLISSSYAQVSRGVELVGNAGGSLERIAAQVANLNDAVAAIASHSFEQASSLQQVDGAMTEADGMMQRTLQIVENSADAASTLASEIANLRSMIDDFQTDNRASGPSARAPLQAAE